MKLEISNFSTMLIPEAWDWVPKQADEVYFSCEFNIEPDDCSAAGHNFFIIVATPEGLAKKAMEFDTTDEKFIIDRNLIIMKNYSWGAFVDHLNEIVTACTRETWNESVLCLQRYFLWEFEDYDPDDS
tara:strand:+ start:102550 stop:102933 length:384 start_codon:yes stop_codon:yes gene_type:complete